jgi:hypothetical protein
MKQFLKKTINKDQICLIFIGVDKGNDFINYFRFYPTLKQLERFYILNGEIV